MPSEGVKGLMNLGLRINEQGARSKDLSPSSILSLVIGLGSWFLVLGS